MPRIFDNIDEFLLPTLRSALDVGVRADFCVGYFNLRGWRKVDDLVEKFAGGEGACCRLLIGIPQLPQTILYESRSLLSASNTGIDNSKVLQFKKQVATEFHQQLVTGTPSNEDEAGLRRLSAQLKTRKLVIKLYLKPLHAKLYLIHRHDVQNPTLGLVGSSNLTLSGLSFQGELNVDVLDHDACKKLQKWFDDRWDDRWCVDISDDLAALLDTSWARKDLIPPYYIYLKIAYHLSQEARVGLSEYKIPRDIGDRLFDFQRAAVQIAAHHVNRRGGVLIGDVVGLGKTLIAATLARILQDDFYLETLIICPKNLVSMWQDYVDNYRLLAKILPLSRVQNELPDLRRYRVVLIDESHNLRNREGKRYRAIQEYIAINESRCILLSATPYNKTYLDLSAQLRLFVPEDKDLGARPEALLEEMGGELEFIRKYQAAVRSLAAFEKSEHPDDWRELMRLYMVRRTRSFIQANYAKEDALLPLEQALHGKSRRYLEFPNGSRAYFPTRKPCTVKFHLGEGADPYAALYSENVVEAINSLSLPRYGLGNYSVSTGRRKLTEAEERQLKGLSRAGKRLMGFSRTNLFKRLESGGPAFIQSIERHILRNYIVVHAIEQGLDLPIGSQEAALLDSRNTDEDAESLLATLFDPTSDSETEDDAEITSEEALDSAEKDFRKRAAAIYTVYATRYKRRFKWIKPGLFKAALKKDLLDDAKILTAILRECGDWQAAQDTKLAALVELLEDIHPQEKVLVFTQFADTVRYLTDALKQRHMTHVEGVTGNSDDPAAIAWKFSPTSNGKAVTKEEELRVLIATDVLSEGLNLQDCAIIVNYDLPWAIIRLIQRAGRVDRIGQTAETILCYSFLPVEGVERIIRLRGRLSQRLKENAEVVGTDEAFFEDDMDEQTILDLYHEKSGVLDGDEDSEVDLTSEAYQIWKNAIDADPSLKKTIENLPPVVYATRRHTPTAAHPEGVLVYVKTAEGNDSLALVDRAGTSVTQSQLAILRMAQCHPDTPAMPRNEQHHDLVNQGAKLILEEEKGTGGQLGRPSGARFRTYERLKRYAQAIKGTLFESQDLLSAIDTLYRHPLRQAAIDQLNRQLKSGISDEQLAELVVALHLEDRLCLVHEEASTREPQIICSMGLFCPQQEPDSWRSTSKKARDWLSKFDFHNLFIDELGWNQPSSQKVVESLEIEGTTYERRRIAEMAGVPVLEITAADGEIPKAEERTRIHKEISEAVSIENLLIFVNGDRTRSLWYWAKREGSKAYPRTETYIQNQPADLLLSKIGGLKFELPELDENGEVPVFEVADRLQKSLDVEQVTKNFYKEFELEHKEFLRYIRGIDKESDRRWYVSVILNRLMFVYFLQKKGFLDGGDTQYLSKKLKASQKKGADRFFNEFLETLFFEGFAKPERDRSDAVKALIGKVCYLNGGLFLKHQIEQTYPSIEIPDEGFQRVFALFEKYSWHLDDRPAGKPNEINPDVLGYIFEKYINQKAFGAYYTRPEITEYLCDRTINKLILDRVNATLPQQQDPCKIQQFESIDDLVMHMEVDVCRHLVYGEDSILRNLSLLDPACGSGAFLIAAMKTLVRIYERVIGVVQLSSDHQLRGWLKQVEDDHHSLPYFIKKRIITDNLYGVDIMEEAVEIAKLRLFLALVSSAIAVDELEPLPNIDFNIMAGNSLIGLIRVEEESFNELVISKGMAIDPVQGNLIGSTIVQGSLLGLDAVNRYREILEEKNRSIELYKKHSFERLSIESTTQEDRLQMLRDHINTVNRESEGKLNQLLLNEFTQGLRIKYEQVQLQGKPKKRDLRIQDIEALKPFHWGYHFDRVMDVRGGFDVIIANPPWDVFQTDEKEFFHQYDDLIRKKKLDIKTWNNQRDNLLKDTEIAQKWLDYCSSYPHVSAFFKGSASYKNQISKTDGKVVSRKINLYSLFLERCFNLLKQGGECGILVPSSIYTDLGSKQLREMLFSQTQITSLFGLSNEKFIFDEVHHSFKIAFLTFEKGKSTEVFDAAFRINPREAVRVGQLKNFFQDAEQHIAISVSLIRKLSPDSLSVMEFKGKQDIVIAEKMLKFPLLREKLPDKWNLTLRQELNMTSDSHLFQQESGQGRLPLYEGKMIGQFTHQYGEPRYWVNENKARKTLLGKSEDVGQELDYQSYRLAFRLVGENTNLRNFIVALIPRNVFCGHSLGVSRCTFRDSKTLVLLCVLFNSFIVDYSLRAKIARNVSFFSIYQLPIPRLVEGDPYFNDIIDRAAKLICTTPEFDDLAAEVGLGSHANGVVAPIERAQLRAELDGMIAHLYGLTEAEFTHILSTFPIVPEEVKQAALEEYRNFAPKVGDAEILNLIAKGESAKLEFKSTARWDLDENKKNPVMEEVILKTVAAFLNSAGGTLLIGVNDEGNILGLQHDYQTLRKKDRDGFELWLMGDLLLKSLGNDLAPQISVSFGIIETKEVCKVTVQPSPRPAYCEIKNKSGQSEECFFIRAGNQTKHLTKPSEIMNYTQTRWS